MSLDLDISTDGVLTADTNLVQSWADLNALKQSGARTVIVSAEGAMVRDSEGNELIDGIGGLWCVNAGHRRAEIIDAITEQLNTLDFYSTFYNFTHPTAAALAVKLAELAPGNLNKVHFGNSGSVANETAIRILHHYYNRLGQPQKKRILCRHGAYHGSTNLTVAMTTPGYSEGWGKSGEWVHHLRCPHHWREAPEMTEAEFLEALKQDLLDTIAHYGAETIACMVAEPIMGAGGVIVPPEGYHAEMAAICRAHDIKYVTDEVVTAFGRLGHFFASKDVFGVQPDIINTAKGLTSGYQPLSATIMSDEIHEVISGPGGMFFHGMTYSGHPAAAAAGLANIALMERDQIPQRVQVTGKRFEGLLRQLEEFDIVGEVRGSHFMMGIEFVKNKETKEPFAPEEMIGLRVAREAQKRGLIARPLGNILILSPTLIMDEAMIDRVADILKESIAALQSSL
ncbi:aminotransferase class III-fold pyridoxal phosphate-dependent enzyme [Salipiger sp. PrR002]|uniref:aminotransferase class III-fold pyridoxal phosphate-dependent enzyme n=1 Tax=Salipiger sp. PrR002 TaxID=2706489 RepID=UPI0013BDD448|nr:aminotransferase class III-fold pyridoxal phosphate-dependent enzyme [Salipiger sp. PrR002]NDV98414.1 aminotransferase class III-fold pyridoxal phosphate-dependent enzyme [Salipiger sp. PrR002]NDW55126.1 aminotransferase class III-fold pyridoxal phosphate-dependent enzyme [Salipiger sp. PrR004]